TQDRIRLDQWRSAHSRCERTPATSLQLPSSEWAARNSDSPPCATGWAPSRAPLKSGSARAAARTSMWNCPSDLEGNKQDLHPGSLARWLANTPGRQDLPHGEFEFTLAEGFTQQRQVL